MASTHHLMRRNGVWYYRRRVPDGLISVFGKSFIQHSLDTRDLKQAKRLREVRDIEWSARFAAAEGEPETPELPAKPEHASPDRLRRLVFDYVERMDARFDERLAVAPPESEQQKSDITQDIEIGLQMVADRDDPRGAQHVYQTGKRILANAHLSLDGIGPVTTAFLELVRRALIELDRRKLARIGDDHSTATFDTLFDKSKKPAPTFGEVAMQRLKLIEEDAETNDRSLKWIEKVRAIMGAVREIVGDTTPITDVDYDACMKFRSTLARIPANRTKLYGSMPLEKAIKAASIDGRPTLSATTQEVYLTAFKSVLDLAAKKRLIGVNPADGMRPLKRDEVGDDEKRPPLSLDQLAQFFGSEFYERAAASGTAPYRFDAQGGWRFWLPLICLFSGMRPNEVCSLQLDDIRKTKAGVWYFDVNRGLDSTGKATKNLKTATSKRRIPIHPELMKLGLLAYIDERRAANGGSWLFDLKPNRHDNRAWYALKRFAEVFLPRVLKLENGQSSTRCGTASEMPCAALTRPPTRCRPWAAGAKASSSPTTTVKSRTRTCRHIGSRSCSTRAST